MGEQLHLLQGGEPADVRVALAVGALLRAHGGERGEDLPPGLVQLQSDQERAWFIREKYSSWITPVFERKKNILKNFFGGLQCVGHFFAHVAHDIFLRDFWNLESCRSKQARYQLSLPSPCLATHFPA